MYAVRVVLALSRISFARAHVAVLYLGRQLPLVRFTILVQGLGFLDLPFEVKDVVPHQVEVDAVRIERVAAALLVQALPLGIGFFQFLQEIFWAAHGDIPI